MELSNCCDAPRWLETDLCGQCKERADFYGDDDLELNDDAKRICNKNIDNHCRMGCPLTDACATKAGEEKIDFIERMNKAATKIHNEYGI